MKRPLHQLHQSTARSPLVMGLVLLIVGAGLLATNLGYQLPPDLWQYWPLLLIFPGLAALVRPNRHLGQVAGVWLLATGLYAQTGIYGWLGLSWGTAWPIFMVAWGLAVILDRRGPRDGSSNGKVSRVIHE